MERVMLNLLENAARFAKTQIQVRAHIQAEQIVVSVSDDGPGIPNAERERVFDSFVRLNNAHNSSQRGFGLGLAIVKRLMRWHKGEACISDTALGGACFSVYWPHGNLG
jgi:K+-sensing histidine kinase KdpD